MAVAPAGNTNVSPQNYGGVPPNQEQVVEFKQALNDATISDDASGTQSSNGPDHSQDTSKSLPIILANGPPINRGNPIDQQATPLQAGTAPTAPAPAPAEEATAATTQTVPGTSTPLP